MDVTQRLIDQVEGGEEKTLAAIDGQINALPADITFADFKNYAYAAFMIIDAELHRR